MDELVGNSVAMARAVWPGASPTATAAGTGVVGGSIEGLPVRRSGINLNSDRKSALPRVSLSVPTPTSWARPTWRFGHAFSDDDPNACLPSARTSHLGLARNPGNDWHRHRQPFLVVFALDAATVCQGCRPIAIVPVLRISPVTGFGRKVVHPFSPLDMPARKGCTGSSTDSLPGRSPSWRSRCRRTAAGGLHRQSDREVPCQGADENQRQLPPCR